MKEILIHFWMLLFIGQISAQTTIKIMGYNLLHFDAQTDRKYDLKYILDTYQPDIFTVCELESEAASDTILNVCLNHDQIDTYRAASFHYNESGYYQDLNQMLYYNHHKFELVYETLLHTAVRDINHYVLKLNTQSQDANSVFIDVYVAHLKSSNGYDNEQTRLDMVNVFTNDLQNIPDDHFIIFAGDLNLYSSTEPAYQELLDSTNSIVMNDPIDMPGHWSNNSGFASIHTQSTHRYGSGLFIGGGLDDRFDFILLSENMMDAQNQNLHYQSQTYAAYGNNGTCYNQAITSSACDGGTYNAVLRAHLYNLSDHLPIVLQLETNRTLDLPVTQKLHHFYISSENPAHDFVRVAGSTDEPVSIRIFDLMGHKLLQIDHYQPNTPVDISGFSSNIYVIEVKYKNYTQPIKFVKSD